jgi:hypothetical protein
LVTGFYQHSRVSLSPLSCSIISGIPQKPNWAMGCYGLYPHPMMQIFPNALEAAHYDSSGLSLFHSIVAVLL